MSRKRPRIMMISTHGYVSAEPEFGLPDTGGQVVYLLELSKTLARLGFRVDIYTRRFEKQPAMEAVSDGVRILRQPCGGRDFIPKETLCEYIPEWVANVRDYIRGKKLGYAFINSHYWDAGLAGQSLSNQLEIPHLHTPHSLGAWKRENMDGPPVELERKYNFARRIRDERYIYTQSNVLIATTSQQRDIMRNDEYDVPGEKIKVIPPGYDDTRFYPVSNATRATLKRELRIEGPLVLALGRMAHNKGYDLLIQSMPAIVKRVPEARLLLAVGSTDPTEAETQQVNGLHRIVNSLGIEKSVLFHDYISDEDLADYYRAADVFALSSRYEPFGMTAVEAMACGTPTVVTTEGGLWELINWGNDALYENPFEPEAFGYAIASILKHPRVAQQLARAGSQTARARFTWTGIAQQVLNLIDGLKLDSKLRNESERSAIATREREREKSLAKVTT